MDQQNYDSMDELTLQDILQIFKRRKWWFVATVIIVVALTFVYLLYATPIYQSSATIKIESQSSGLSLSAAALLGGGGGNSDVSNKTTLIKTLSNYDQLIKDLDLTHNKLFAYHKSTSFLHKIKVFFLGETNIPTDIAIRNNIINYLNNNITVSTVKDSNVVKVEVSSEDPKLATQIANDIVKIFINQQVSMNRKTLVKNKSFIDSEVKSTEQVLDQLYDKIANFQKKYKVVSLDAQAQYYATTLSNLDTAEYQLANNLAEAKKSIEAIDKIMNVTYKNVITTNAISNDAIVSKLRNQLLQYNVQLQGMKQMYAVNDPQIKSVEAEILEVKKQLQNRIAEIVSNSDNSVSSSTATVSGQVLNTSLYSSMLQQKIEAELKYQVLQASEEALNKFKKTLESKLELLPEGIKEYTLLQRDLKTKTAIYSMLVQKSLELQLQIQSTDGGVQLVDAAEMPYVPVKPNKKLVLAIGLVLGIFLGILFVFLVEARDKTLKSSYEVQKYLGYKNIIGEISKENLIKTFNTENKFLQSEELVVVHNPNSPISENIKIIASNIGYLKSDSKILEITSSYSNSGKTFLTANLALSFAQTGMKTALVDLNLRSSRMDKLFNFRSNKDGVVNYVLKEEKIDNILHPMDDNLDFIPSGPIPQNPTSVLGSYKLKILMEELKKRYDMVLLDTANVIGYSDVPIMGRFVDSAVLIVKPTLDTIDSISKSKEVIEIAGVKFVGYIINDI
jgi:capsular exopolysaccharide synthesis family protein